MFLIIYFNRFVHLLHFLSIYFHFNLHLWQFISFQWTFLLFTWMDLLFLSMNILVIYMNGSSFRLNFTFTSIFLYSTFYTSSDFNYFFMVHNCFLFWLFKPYYSTVQLNCIIILYSLLFKFHQCQVVSLLLCPFMVLLIQMLSKFTCFTYICHLNSSYLSFLNVLEFCFI